MSIPMRLPHRPATSVAKCWRDMADDEENEERWFDEMQRAKMLSRPENARPHDDGQGQPSGACCDERCCTSGSVHRIGERTYECSLHGRIHMCGTTYGDEHPVIIETETGGVCLFSGLVIDQNIVQDVAWSDGRWAAHLMEVPCDGQEEGEEGETSMEVDGPQTRAQGGHERSSGRCREQQQQRSETDMRNFCMRVMRKLFDRGKRQQCDEKARARAIAEAQMVDRAYVKGCLRDNVMTSAPRRRSLILATLARHARLPFVRVPEETLRRWAAAVDGVWRVLTRETMIVHRDPSSGRRAVQTRRLTFVFGVLHFMGSPDGLRHESGVIVIRHDPEISACLPRPHDLETLGFRQRCESAGWKQLRVMVHEAVESIAQRLLGTSQRNQIAEVHSRAAIRLSAMIALAILAQRRRGLS